MSDEITATRTCGDCTNVTSRCVRCVRWFCPHLLKRWAGSWFCADCFPKETE